ncbi:MAG TPA: hypothetical protein VFO67_13425 [Gemmatimonadales bacterium]|nr:hypothetical protein [Gemmatimonadales bacterium]
MIIARVVIAHLLSLIVAPFAAVSGVLALAAVTSRLTLWRTAPGAFPTVFSMPAGGFGWQVSSSLARAVAAFAAMRLVFWLLAVAPNIYAAGTLIIMLLAWDIYQLRFVQRPTLAAPASAIAVRRFKIGAGLLASTLMSILYVRC